MIRLQIVFVISFVLIACKSTPAAGSQSATANSSPIIANQPIKSDGPTTATGGVTDAEIETMREAFFNRKPESEEVFRVFITSDGYKRHQVSYPEKVSVKEDVTGDQAIADEFKKFDMVNSLQEGQIRVELYPTTGKFYRVRQTKPSVMKETDKIMSDDLTRWQFQFVKDEIQPRDMRISYQVLLRKRITREQALKILSEQNKKK